VTTHSEGTIGAVGAQESADQSANSSIKEKIDSVGDAAYFDFYQSSGNLDNLHGDHGTRIVFPETMHNDPQYGHVIHFDIFYKKNPKMEDVTSKIESLFTFDTLREDIQNLGGDVSGTVSDFVSNGSVNEQQDGLLGAIQSAIGMNTGDPSVQPDSVTEDTRLGKATEKSLDKVTLYMPKGLANTDTLNYTDVDYGLIKGIMEGNLATLIPGIASKAAGFVDGLAQITNTELNMSSAISSVTGTVRNPRKEQLFESVGFRTFEFTFNLFPKTKQESHQVMEMVKLFRFHAYPEIVPNQAFYRFPSEFQISFIDLKYPTNNPFQSPGSNGVVAEVNQWLNRIARCALTNVSTQYFPMDSMSTFADGAPTMVNITLTFSEMEALSRNHIKAGF
tara:strand:+ start:448 stop:1620 length:1173 start_codon:yes stop_codon:yes gene_type:complete